MPDMNRRTVLAGACASLAGIGLAAPVVAQPLTRRVPLPPEPPFASRGIEGRYTSVYGPIRDEPFPIPAAPLSRINPAYLRMRVAVETREPPGTIVVDPRRRYLYLIGEGGYALRYGVGVGRQGFSWSGTATINSKQHWPDWYPPKEMIERQPELKKQIVELQSGLGVPGGPRNPLGARALYLWQNNKDTLYRIHGTIEPWTIGTSVSSGCIRMINQDVIDLYERVPLGTKVVVLA